MIHLPRWVRWLSLKQCLIIWLLILSVVSPQFTHLTHAIETRTITLTPIDDAYIDSAYPNVNYGSSTVLALEYYQGLLVSRRIETWFRFNLSSIPPQATILSATLWFTVSYLGQTMNATACRSTDVSWSESTITYSNAPRGTLPSDSTYTDYTTVGSLGEYVLIVTKDVRNALSSGVLTEVLRVHPPIKNDMLIGFHSDERGVEGPKLVASFSFVSSYVTLSDSSTMYGRSVTISGGTDPKQTNGTVILQYSTNEIEWKEIASGIGGIYSFSWPPPYAGAFYIRSLWRLTWTNGAYTAESNIATLTVLKAAVLISTSLSANTMTPNGTVTITTTLNPPLSGVIVALEYSTDGSRYVAIGQGRIEGGRNIYEWTPPGIGKYYVRARWEGNISYNPATSPPQTLVVALVVTTLTLSTTSSAKIGDTLAVTATLRESGGNPLSGQKVVFALNSTTLGEAMTSQSGVASLTFKLAVPPGTYVAKALYIGSERYQGSENSVVVIINPYRLTVTSAVAQAPLVSLNGSSYVTDSSGKVTIPINATGRYTLKVNSPLLLSPGKRAVFMQWADGTTSHSRTVDIDSDQAFTVNTKNQFHLTVNPNGGIAIGEGWYDGGSTAFANATSPCNVVQDRSRLKFMKWSGDSTSTSNSVSFKMDSPRNVTANWVTQYYLKVISEYGKPQGEGWYDAGSSIEFSVTSPLGLFIQQVFTGWSGDSSASTPSTTIVINGPKTVTAKWQTDYTQLIIVGVAAAAVTVAVVIAIIRRRTSYSGF